MPTVYDDPTLQDISLSGVDPAANSAFQDASGAVNPGFTSTDASNLANGALGIGSLFPGVQNLLSNGQLNASQAAYQNAINAVNAAKPLQLSNYIPRLTQQVMQGQMTPAQAQAAQATAAQMSAAQSAAAQQGKSNMGGITTNPAAMGAELDTLQQLKNIASNGGLTPTDKAQLMQINDQVNAQNQGRQLAVQQQAREQGIGGSGADLAGRLSSAQAANTAASESGTNVAANAQQRALQAMLSGADIGSNLENQQFGEAAAKAQAQDAINQFNTGLAQQTNLANQSTQQQANMANMGAQNQIGLANMGAVNTANLANQQSDNLSGLSNFNMANQIGGNNTNIANEQNMLPLNTAMGQNNQNANWARTAVGANYNQGAQLGTQARTNTANNSSTVGNLISAAPGIINAGTDLWNAIGSWSDERLKTDTGEMTDEEVDQLMHKLTKNKYRYKKGSVADDGGKLHFGVMAQDLEKTPAGNAVVNTSKGKVVLENDSKQNMTLAVLKNVVDRMNAGGL